MKIALVIEHFDASRGGAEHMAVWVAGEVAKRGHEVVVLCHDARRRLQPMRAAHQGASHDAERSAHSHGREEAVIPAGVLIHRFRGPRLSTGIGFRLFGQRARLWCRKHHPDVVHSMTVAFAGDIYHPEAGVYARMQQQAVNSRATATSAKFKHFMQRLNGKQRALLALERRAVGPWSGDHHSWQIANALADTSKQSAGRGGPWRIISISAGMTREFQEHYGLSGNRLVRLDNPRIQPEPQNNGAPQSSPQEDRAWFRTHYALAETDRVALFIGHDFRRKGLRYAIEALARTRDPWKLLVVGLGKVREPFELAEKLGLAERVKFVGPTREVQRIYHASDALLLPVFYDPAPLVVIEALSNGLPVISTRHLGSAEIIEQNQAGVIVDEPQNVAALAAALDGLPMAPENTSGRAALEARARRAAEGVPGEAFIQRLLALYEACAAAKRSPA